MKKYLVLLIIMASVLTLFGCATKTEEASVKPKPHLTYTEPELMRYGNQITAVVWAEGIIENVGEVTAYEITVKVTFYDTSGVILYEGSAYKDELRIGESWKYSVYYKGMPTKELDYKAKVVVSCE